MFYSISAALAIALGTSLVTLGPEILKYEKEAILMKYKFEERNNIELNYDSNCEVFAKNKTECKKTVFFLKSTEKLGNYFALFIRYVIPLAFISFCFGAFFHYIAFHKNHGAAKT